MNNFWEKFNNNYPALVLAPMAGLTDSAFRQVCKRFGADIVYSEMISAAALFHNDRKTFKLMEFDETERPYVVQLFGNDAAHFKIAAVFVAKNIKPDGIDLNFGCPVPKVVKQGAGTALFQDLKRARAAVKAVTAAVDLPVSVKTRSRAGKTDVLEFLDNIADLGVKAAMIHGRGGQDGFLGPVETDIIKKARDHFGGKIIANGGVHDYCSARELLEKTAADGLGIGQGALGRPWVFKAVRTGQDIERSRRAVYKAARAHAELAFQLKGGRGIIEMRQHLAWYVKGLPGAGQLKTQLVKADSLADINKILQYENKEAE